MASSRGLLGDSFEVQETLYDESGGKETLEPLSIFGGLRLKHRAYLGTARWIQYPI